MRTASGEVRGTTSGGLPQMRARCTPAAGQQARRTPRPWLAGAAAIGPLQRKRTTRGRAQGVPVACAVEAADAGLRCRPGTAAASCAVGRPAPAMVTARRSEEAWQTPASVSGTRARLLVAVTRPGAPNRANTRGRCARWRRSAADHHRRPPRPAGPTAARRRHRTPAAVRPAPGCGTGSRPGASTGTAGRPRWRRRAWPPARG